MGTAENPEVIRPAKPPVDPALVIYREILVLEITDQASLAVMVDNVAKLEKAIDGIKEWFKPMLADAKVAVDAAKTVETGIKTKQTESVKLFVEAATKGRADMKAWLTAERERARLDQLRIEQENAAAKKLEQDRFKEAAETMKGLGNETAAAALTQEADRVVEAPAFVPTVDKTIRTSGGAVAGGATMSAPVKLVYQVVDVKAFLRYLVEKDSAAAFVEFPVAKLNAWGKANGIKKGEVPGLAVKEEVIVSIRK